MTAESSRMAAPSLFRNRQYVIAHLRHDDPSVMSHLILYKSDSLEPIHPLSPLPQRGEGRFNSSSMPSLP